ncbi:hypothetical protein AAEU31_05135 [Pseudoalteromonas sp. SSMSWG5]|jgi:hypothetical protein|uniref:hypothetical protein n=1 Tax=Pseudoalteromonas TaxID=53246 RepID=UPI000C4089A3|nr:MULTISPECIES: hypothetical protein [unclassified Pseudoalteromonas]MBD57329.1 hypothetical protein [Pseudoalteromonas sp.]MBU75860.1 hypothetical protein [Pseudoalteromonadaceae bacterium]MCF2902504.1 hypothetical protein [Pseudoalteromonas sp. OFAV1]MCF2921835.1 hypothetical protein [Pseudoalteromonas sp. APAL1]MCO7250712.1 hypothetical protein [Pseudoalteromonas sp. Ps84H-4]|tara:strand:- start:4104 stop:4376 length:273 start_codon:yes stop_codon:yes gene_type:complete
MEVNDIAGREELDQNVMNTLRDKDHSTLANQVDTLLCSHNDIIELLAQYLALSEQDDDERFDHWFDNLSKEQHTVVKTFEVYRGHYEHLD